MKVHHLKIWPEQLRQLVAGRKQYEFRKDDRGFAVGDYLQLHEWVPEPGALVDGRTIPGNMYTGRSALVRVIAKSESPEFNLPLGYCLMATEYSSACDMIDDERQRQAEVEGWSLAHDDQHTDGSLAMAACYYAYPVNSRENIIADDLFPPGWNKAHAKRDTKDRIRQLVVAGALIAAEIDRLLRAGADPLEDVTDAPSDT